MESIREVDFSGLKVPFVAVYGHPDDFPDKYVARIYELDRATDETMRNIINMIIKIAIIWGAAWMFPEYVKIQDTRTMVLVVATLLIASIVLTVIMMGVLILAALPGNGVGIGIAMLITIIMALASGIIQLMAAVHFVPGFEIHGKLTYIILALLMAVFSIEEKKEA